MKSRFRLNILSMAIFQASNYLVPLLNYPFLTRVLQVHSYGVFGLSFAIATYPVLLADWGFGISAPGEVARRRDDPAALAQFFWNTLAAKAVMSLIALTILAIAILLVPSMRAIWPVLLAANLTVVTSVLTVNWCLQGLERLELFAIAATIGRLSTVPATYLLVSGPEDAWVAAAVQVGGGLLVGLISIFLLVRLRIIGRARVTLSTIRHQIIDGRHLFFAAASGNFYTTFNTVILGFLAGPGAVGIYVAADRLRAASQGVIQPLSQAAYPRSSRMFAESRAAGMDFARKVLLAQGILTLGVALTLILGAPLIMTLMAGSKYVGSINVLRVLGIAPFLVGLSDVLGVQLLLPMKLRERYSRIRIQGTLVNLAFVIPGTLFLGVVGTATGTVAAEAYILGAMAMAVRKQGFTVFKRPATGAALPT